MIKSDSAGDQGGRKIKIGKCRPLQKKDLDKPFQSEGMWLRWHVREALHPSHLKSPPKIELFTYGVSVEGCDLSVCVNDRVRVESDIDGVLIGVTPSYAIVRVASTYAGDKHNLKVIAVEWKWIRLLSTNDKRYAGSPVEETNMLDALEGMGRLMVAARDGLLSEIPAIQDVSLKTLKDLEPIVEAICAATWPEDLLESEAA